MYNSDKKKIKENKKFNWLQKQKQDWDCVRVVQITLIK